MTFFYFRPMLGVIISYVIGGIKVSGFVYLREKIFLTYNMELYHLIHSFPKLKFVMVCLSNVCCIMEVDDVIIQRVCSCCRWSADTATV